VAVLLQITLGEQQMSVKVYGPVNLSPAGKSFLSFALGQGVQTIESAYIFLEGTKPAAERWLELNSVMQGHDDFPIRATEFGLLVEEIRLQRQNWGDLYPVITIYEMSGTGLKTHMTAGELEIGRKFQIDGVSGGAGVAKQWRRLGNPFGSSVVDDKIAAKVVHAYDGTDGKTEYIHIGVVVRPILQALDAPDNFVGGNIKTPAELLKSKQHWNNYTQLLGEIRNRVDDYVSQHSPHSVRVNYSAYPTVNDLPVNNLDEVAVEGRVVFIGDEDYESPVLVNPTWLELCVHFNNQIEATGDYHHYFLESVHSLDKFVYVDDEAVPAYRFSSGS
jgi:hypothetical protein